MTGTGQAASFLVDSPERLDEDSDAFGHRDYAQAVAQTLTDAPAPFTVGIFGPWGVGKSTIIGEVRRRLPDHVGFAYYDAWRYDGDALRRQLLRDVARQLDDTDQLRGFDPDKDLEELEVAVQETQEGIAFSWPRLLRTAIGAALVAAMVFLFLRARQGAELFTGRQPLTDAGVAAVVFLFGTVLALLREPFQITQRVLGTQRLEEPDRFAAKFEQLMACVSAERVVIAIDNLDRCSPDRAVEILSTIKTYLEPALEPDRHRRWLPPLSGDGRERKPAVFLIAADVEALRRHLLSKELERTNQAEVDAAPYVDEYLRKFFSATLPIRASLDTEMRTYVASQLSELVRTAGLDEPDRKKLIEMVAAALGRNPRRVKQFANNLELRLRLIVARETEAPGHTAMILPAISDQPLAVAKLALVEEEWPAYFRALLKQPRSLERWELAARGVSQLAPGAIGPAPPVPTDIDGNAENWNALAAFLRASDGVSIRNPRPFLRLKQSDIEVRLPDHAEFLEAIAAGERDGVMAILEQADEEQRRALEEELPNVLARELDESYMQGALRVVDLVISQKALDQQVRVTVLHRAVSDPRVKAELARLEPQLLLEAGQALPGDDYAELQILLADRLPAQDISEGEQRTIAEALANLGAALTDDARERIRLAIDQATLPQRPDIVVIFAKADETLITQATIQRHLTQFTSAGEQASRPGQFASTLRIVLAGVRAHKDQHGADTVGAYITNALKNDVVHPEGIQDADLYIEAIDSIAPLVPAVISALLQSIMAWLAEIDVSAHAPLLGILGSTLTSVEEPQRSELANQAIEQLFRDPDAAVTLLQRDGRDLPAMFKPLIFQRLTSVLVSGQAARARVPPLLSEFATAEEAHAAIADAAQSALDGDDFAWAVELVRASPVSFQQRGGAMLEHTLNRIPQVDIGPRSQALTLAAELCQFSDATQRVRMTSLLQGQILDADPGHAELAIATALAMAGDDAVDFDLGTIVVACAQRVLTTPAEEFQAFHLLRFVCAHLEGLPADEGDGLYRHVERMLARPDQIQTICDALAAVPDSYPEGRRRLAGVLIESSRQGDIAERTILIRAAQTLAANTDAAADLDVRIGELGASENAADKEVYAALQG